MQSNGMQPWMIVPIFLLITGGFTMLFGMIGSRFLNFPKDGGADPGSICVFIGLLLVVNTGSFLMFGAVFFRK